MASKITNLRIPVTVTTEGVDKGLNAVERKLRNSAAKMKRLGGAAGAAGGAGGGLKSQQGTALLGGVGKLGPIAGALGGLGVAGLGMAAPLAMFGLAAQSVQTMAAATKGASDALALFQQSGEQTFTANSEYLKKLAALESQSQIAAAGPGVMEAFSIASARPGEEGMMSMLNDFAKQSAAFAGATLGGKSFVQATLEAALVTASEAQAKEIAAQMAALEKQRMDVGLADVLNPLSSLPQKIDQIAIYLGKL